MRNLLQYPITPDEVLECLRSEADAINDRDVIGDMRPLLLTEAAKELEGLWAAISWIEDQDPQIVDAARERFGLK